jgi:hypothetical protein
MRMIPVQERADKFCFLNFAPFPSAFSFGYSGLREFNCGTSVRISVVILFSSNFIVPFFCVTQTGFPEYFTDYIMKATRVTSFPNPLSNNFYLLFCILLCLRSEFSSFCSAEKGRNITFTLIVLQKWNLS